MLLHADNFNTYGTDIAFMLNGEYAEVDSAVTLVADPDGVSVPRCLRVRGGGGGGGNYAKIRKVLPAPSTTVGQCARIWLDELPNEDDIRPWPFMWADVNNATMGRLQIMTTGALAYYSGGGDLEGVTGGPVITANGWFHIEAKLVTSSIGTGTLEVRVEGRTVLEIENLTTGVNPVAQVRVANDPDNTSASVVMFVKDYVIWDGTGTYNNDFLGSVIVYELIPTADVAFPWDSTAANGFSVLDNNPPDNAAFISADFPALPAACEFSMSNLPDDVSSVKGVFVKYRAGKIDGGDGSLQPSIVSNAAVGNGVDRSLTVAQTYWRDLFEEDPDTNSLWVPGAVDAMTVRLNRTT